MWHEKSDIHIEEEKKDTITYFLCCCVSVRAEQDRFKLHVGRRKKRYEKNGLRCRNNVKKNPYPGLNCFHGN